MLAMTMMAAMRVVPGLPCMASCPGFDLLCGHNNQVRWKRAQNVRCRTISPAERAYRLTAGADGAP
jgi:hypothetical protein